MNTILTIFVHLYKCILNVYKGACMLFSLLLSKLLKQSGPQYLRVSLWLIEHRKNVSNVRYKLGDIKMSAKRP